jgi:uncharacterized phage infection (PIP) family protein YhgE
VRRANIVLAAASFLLFAALTVAAEDPVSGFLAGLKSVLSYYNNLQNWVVTQHIPEIKRRILADKMQHLADAFYQLQQGKGELTTSISNFDGTPLNNNPNFEAQLNALRQTIACVQANLNDFALQIENQTSINGPNVKDQLSQGLSQKAENIKQIATDMGLKSVANEDPLETIKKESQKSEQLAGQLVTASLKFAKALDPSSTPPPIHKPCVFPQRVP